jgi:hypothetical protein
MNQQLPKRMIFPRTYLLNKGELCLTLSIAVGASIIRTMPAIAAPDPERFAPKFAIGPSIAVVIGSKSEFFYGADAQVGLSDRFAFRPFVAVSNSESASIYGASLTYNFPITRSRETKVRGQSYPTPLGGTITERDTTVGGGEISPFIGVGGVVASRNLSNSSLQPYAVVGVDAPIGVLQAQYLFDERVTLLKGSLAFRF